VNIYDVVGDDYFWHLCSCSLLVAEGIEPGRRPNSGVDGGGKSSCSVVLPDERGPGDSRCGLDSATGHRRAETVLRELFLRLSRSPTFHYEGAAVLSNSGQVGDQPGRPVTLTRVGVEP